MQEITIMQKDDSVFIEVIPVLEVKSISKGLGLFNDKQVVLSWTMEAPDGQVVRDAVEYRLSEGDVLRLCALKMEVTIDRTGTLNWDGLAKALKQKLQELEEAGVNGK